MAAIVQADWTRARRQATITPISPHRAELSTMAKTATFGVLHLGTSFTVGYLLTGSVAIAGAITFVEPVVNTVMHYFFEKYWSQREARRARASMAIT
jgi:uncharacterized membrane protein